MKNQLILLGGGGHCKSSIDVIEAEGKYTIKGILDTKDKIGSTVLHYPIIGSDDSLEEYIKEGYSFLITVGQVASAGVRKKLYGILLEKNAPIATIISPFAKVSSHAQIGRGTIVMHGVFVNAAACVGNNVILNTGCLVEHDTRIGDHVHISTQAVLNGNVIIEDECFIGSNSVVNHGKNIKSGIVVGAGSVVVNHIETAGVYVGCPAKKIK